MRGPRAPSRERAAARIRHEAGARVATSVALRDLNLDIPDSRKIEAVSNLEVGGTVQWRGVDVQAARSGRQRLPCAAAGLARAGR